MSLVETIKFMKVSSSDFVFYFAREGGHESVK